MPEWEDFDSEGRRKLFESFLALLSHAKRESPKTGNLDDPEPFLTVHVHLWLRELRYLVRKVQPASVAPVFEWADEGLPVDHNGETHWLPTAHCRECGSVGMATFKLMGQQDLKTDLPSIGRNWLGRSRGSCFVAFGHENEIEGFPRYLCPQCMRVQEGEGAVECDQCKDTESGSPVVTIAIRLIDDCSEKVPPRFLACCPDCDTNHTLSMLGSRAPSLLSVAIGHLFQSDFNDDKKLLAFTDSVQDASHRSGFFGARTYRFNIRTALQAAAESAGEERISLSELPDLVWAYWSADFSKRRRPEKLVPTLLPADLRELPTYMSFLERGGKGTHSELEEQVRERLSWEATMEYGLNARVGRTLEATLCSTIEIDASEIARVSEIMQLEFEENWLLDAPRPQMLSREAIDHFLAGIFESIALAWWNRSPADSKLYPKWRGLVSPH